MQAARRKEAELLVAAQRKFDPEDGGSTFLRNVVELLPDYTESYPSSQLLP
jgi:hypothetical protein